MLPHMIDSEKMNLVYEHAQLTAANAGGDVTVQKRLAEIEAKLEMSTEQIARIAVGSYLSDY